MDRVAALRTRLEQARDLPAILDAAYDAFEGMLLVIHGQEDRAGGGLPPSYCRRRRQQMAVTRCRGAFPAARDSRRPAVGS